MKTKSFVIVFLSILVAISSCMLMQVQEASKRGGSEMISDDRAGDVISDGKSYKTQTCSESGCDNLIIGGANSRCDSCQKKYDSGNTLPACNYSGCDSKRISESFYCAAHTCQHGSCTSKVTSGSNYCSSHTCGRGRSGCYKEVSSANDKCSSCKNGSKSSSSTTKKETTTNKPTTTNKNSSSSKKKYAMPDCDDYEDYDDFMDDWDGCMPDGSDAEDYWENW